MTRKMGLMAKWKRTKASKRNKNKAFCANNHVQPKPYLWPLMSTASNKTILIDRQEMKQDISKCTRTKFKVTLPEGLQHDLPLLLLLHWQAFPPKPAPLSDPPLCRCRMRPLSTLSGFPIKKSPKKTRLSSPSQRKMFQLNISPLCSYLLPQAITCSTVHRSAISILNHHHGDPCSLPHPYAAGSRQEGVPHLSKALPAPPGGEKASF